MNKIFAGVIGLLLFIGAFFGFQYYQDQLKYGLSGDEVRATLIDEIGPDWRLTLFDISTKEQIGDTVQPIWKFRLNSEAALIENRMSWVARIGDQDIVEILEAENKAVDTSGIGFARYNGSGWDYELQFDRGPLALAGSKGENFSDGFVVEGTPDAQVLVERLRAQIADQWSEITSADWASLNVDIVRLEPFGTRNQPSWRFNHTTQGSLKESRFVWRARAADEDILEVVHEADDLFDLSGNGSVKLVGTAWVVAFDYDVDEFVRGSKSSMFSPSFVVQGTSDERDLMQAFEANIRDALDSFAGDTWLLRTFIPSDLTSGGNKTRPTWRFQQESQFELASDRFAWQGRMFGVDIIAPTRERGLLQNASDTGEARFNGSEWEFQFNSLGLDFGPNELSEEAFRPEKVLVDTDDARALFDRFFQLVANEADSIQAGSWNLADFAILDLQSAGDQSRARWNFDYLANVSTEEDTYVPDGELMDRVVFRRVHEAGEEVELRRTGTATEDGVNFLIDFQLNSELVSSRLGLGIAALGEDPLIFGSDEYASLREEFERNEPARVEAAIRQAVTVYYDTRGEWAGTYTIKRINRISVTRLNDAEARADVEYVYTGRNEGVDRRWFLVRQTSSGDWVGQQMGPNNSARF